MIDIQSRISHINGYKSIYSSPFYGYLMFLFSYIPLTQLFAVVFWLHFLCISYLIALMYEEDRKIHEPPLIKSFCPFIRSSVIL